MPNTRFNVGDRVVMRSSRDGLFGRIATINCIRDYNLEIGLVFDEPIPRGHNLNGSAPDGYGWWASSSDIALTDISAPAIPRPMTMQEIFPVGMRVRYTCRDSHRSLHNLEGTVLGYRDDCLGVSFDDYISGLHNLDGLCENGHGYWLPPNHFTPLNTVIKMASRICSCCKQRRLIACMTKGTNGKYTCSECIRIKSYSTRNDTRIHTQKGHNKTYGFEFEVVPNSRADTSAIMSYGWGLIPTSDGSLPSDGIEFKTPTYHSLNGLKPLLRTMSKHADFRHRSCGQHINIGDTEYLNETNMSVIRAFAKDIFDPLYNYMYSNETITKNICGRFFNDYAKRLSNYSNHFSWINLGHDNRIEFRASKYANANQYFQLVCMWTEMVDCVITHFLKKCNNTAVDIGDARAGCDCDECESRRRRAVGINEAYAQNKKAAEKCAKYLVKIFNKYAQGKATCQRAERNSYTNRGTKRVNAA